MRTRDMRVTSPSVRWGRAALLAALLLLVALVAGAGELQEFLGEVASVSATSVSVKNRLGDQRSFARDDSTRVSGKRASWKDLAVGDGVIVSWNFADNPVKAHRVKVISTR